MATPKDVIQTLINGIKSIPPQILWNRHIDGDSQIVVDEAYSVDPISDIGAQNWHTQVILKKSILQNQTFTGKIFVAGDYINLLTDNSNNSIVTTVNNSLLLTTINANAPYQVTSATLNKLEGTMQINWQNARPPHTMLASYQFIKTDINFTDLAVAYYTGDTPYKPQPIYTWGIVVANSGKTTTSSVKTQRLLLYSGRQPYYILEPASASVEATALSDLFKAIELTLLDPFKNFLATTPGVILS